MPRNRFETAGRSTSAKWLRILTIGVALGFAAHAVAQAPAPAEGAAAPPSTDELNDLVGRIALYPDDLVAIILPASTYPLQIVQADRFLEKRKADPKLPIDDKWDDAVKSLLNYPDVVKMMSSDLDWTSALGEAVVADQGAVIEAIQAFRRRANAAGNLKSDDKQVVNVEQQNISIAPADPQVIYVPQYNPTTVVVASPAPVYGYYPTPYPSYYYPYPPGAALATGVLWGAAIGAAWSGNRYGCCGDTNINIDRNTNINRNTNVNRPGQQPAGGRSQWKSNKQPGQVSGSIGKTGASGRVGDARGGAGGYGGSARGGTGRATTQGAGGVGGGAGRGGASGNNAFSGYGSGRQAQMDSARGASSRNSMSGAGANRSAARSAPSGGGARAGGGGRGGGGGGGRGGGGGGGGRGGGGRR